MCFRSTKWARVLRRVTWSASATITWSWTFSATGRTWTPRYSASRAPSFQSCTVRYSPFSYYSFYFGSCLSIRQYSETSVSFGPPESESVPFFIPLLWSAQQTLARQKIIPKKFIPKELDPSIIKHKHLDFNGFVPNDLFSIFCWHLESHWRKDPNP